MTLNRWKVLACTLTVGVGGLAVFATPPAGDKSEPPKDPAPLVDLTVKPTTPANGSDTPAPDQPAKGAQFDLDLPVVPAPVKAEEPAKKPSDLPVLEQATPPLAPIVPVKAEEKAKGEDSKTVDKVPEVVIPPVSADPGDKSKPVVPAPDLSKPIETPKPAVPTLDLPKPDPVKNPMPDLDLPPVKPATPPMATPPDTLPRTVTPAAGTPDSVKLPIAPPTKGSEAAKLKLLLRMGDGQPRFEIRNSASTELLLKVYGERVEMQAPPDAKSSLAGVTAIGRVRFTAPGIEGTCDHLTILSGTGEVLLKGNIHMKSKRGKTWSEMTAEKMVYQIGTSGLSTTATPHNPVTPASYIPD